MLDSMADCLEYVMYAKCVNCCHIGRNPNNKELPVQCSHAVQELNL